MNQFKKKILSFNDSVYTTYHNEWCVSILKYSIFDDHSVKKDIHGIDRKDAFFVNDKFIILSLERKAYQ